LTNIFDDLIPMDSDCGGTGGCLREREFELDDTFVNVNGTEAHSTCGKRKTPRGCAAF
jgi:hypothetical protein